MTKPKRLSKEQLSHAKRMFMNYESITQIAKSMEVARSSIQYHVKNSWDAEREMNKAELFHQLASTKKVHFTNISDAALKIMTRAIEDTANRSGEITLREAQTAAAILETIDKITRLDEGTPTDIISNQEKPMTIVEVQKKIALDPFADSVPAVEYKEVDEKNPN
jgi:hypothetical protein